MGGGGPTRARAHAERAALGPQAGEAPAGPARAACAPTGAARAPWGPGGAGRGTESEGERERASGREGGRGRQRGRPVRRGGRRLHEPSRGALAPAATVAECHWMVVGMGGGRLEERAGGVVGYPGDCAMLRVRRAATTSPYALRSDGAVPSVLGVCFAVVAHVAVAGMCAPTGMAVGVQRQFTSGVSGYYQHGGFFPLHPSADEQKLNSRTCAMTWMCGSKWM